MSLEDTFKKIESMKESVIEDESFKKYFKEYKAKKDDDTEFFEVEHPTIAFLQTYLEGGNGVDTGYTERG